MPRRVLIVDDEVESRMLMEAILQGSGYEVLTANNGKEGLAQIQQSAVDAVFSDVLMPEMDGFTFLKELRRNDQTRGIPFFVTTVRYKMEDAFLAIGAKGFFLKPFDVEIVLNALSTSLGQAPTTAPAQEAAAKPAPTPAAVSPVPAAKKETPAPAPPPVPAAPTKPAAAPVKKSGAAKKAMIAGTNHYAVDTIASYLETQRCHVDMAEGGSDLADRAHVQGPTLIFVDLLMPDIPASEIVRRLRGHSNLKTATIILFAYYDKDTLKPGTTAEQLDAQIESEQKASMEKGATDSIGIFDKGNFPTLVSKYL